MAELPPSVAQNYLGTLIPTVAGSLFVWARLYTRSFMTRNLGTDDALIFAAWVCTPVRAQGRSSTFIGLRHHPFSHQSPISQHSKPSGIRTSVTRRCCLHIKTRVRLAVDVSSLPRSHQAFHCRLLPPNLPRPEEQIPHLRHDKSHNCLFCSSRARSCVFMLAGPGILESYGSPLFASEPKHLCTCHRQYRC